MCNAGDPREFMNEYMLPYASTLVDIQYGDELTVRGGVFALDGSRQLIATASGSAAEAADLGARISDELFAGGAAELLGK